MHLDLVDVLRCPAPHADGWLVCAAGTVQGRELLEGDLGCPICQAEFPIRGGVVLGPVILREARRSVEAPTIAPAPVATPPDEAAVLRLAALLDLSQPDRLIVLAGAWGRFAAALAALVPVRIVLLDALPPPADAAHPLVALHGFEGIPVARAAVHAVALDRAHAGARWCDAAVAALASGGRLVLPAGVPLPAETTLLVEDAHDAVAARAPVGSAPVPLRRGGR